MDAWQSVSGELQIFQICGPKTSTLNFLSQCKASPTGHFKMTPGLPHELLYDQAFQGLFVSFAPLAWAAVRMATSRSSWAFRRCAWSRPTRCPWGSSSQNRAFLGLLRVSLQKLKLVVYICHKWVITSKISCSSQIHKDIQLTIVQQTKVSLTKQKMLPRPRNLAVGSKVWTLCMRCTSPLREWERKITSLPYSIYPPSTKKQSRNLIIINNSNNNISISMIIIMIVIISSWWLNDVEAPSWRIMHNANWIIFPKDQGECEICLKPPKESSRKLSNQRGKLSSWRHLLEPRNVFILQCFMSFDQFLMQEL